MTQIKISVTATPSCVGVHISEILYSAHNGLLAHVVLMSVTETTCILIVFKKCCDNYQI